MQVPRRSGAACTAQAVTHAASRSQHRCGKIPMCYHWQQMPEDKGPREYLSLCAHDREHWFVLAIENPRARWLRCVNCGLRVVESSTRAAVNPLEAKGTRINASK
jgi:hypothetical protein